MSIPIVIGNCHCFKMKRTCLKVKTVELSLICLSLSSQQILGGRASELLIGQSLKPDLSAGALGFLPNLSESQSKGQVYVCNFFGFPLSRSTIGWKSSVALWTIEGFSGTYYDHLRTFSRSWRRQRVFFFCVMIGYWLSQNNWRRMRKEKWGSWTVQ